MKSLCEKLSKACDFTSKPAPPPKDSSSEDALSGLDPGPRMVQPEMPPVELVFPDTATETEPWIHEYIADDVLAQEGKIAEA